MAVLPRHTLRDTRARHASGTWACGGATARCEAHLEQLLLLLLLIRLALLPLLALQPDHEVVVDVGVEIVLVVGQLEVVPLGVVDRHLEAIGLLARAALERVW